MRNQTALIQDALKTGLTRTRSFYVIVPENDEQGIPIGKGACKAVILRLNKYRYNTKNVSKVEYIYFGDSNAQQFELDIGEESQLIVCQDLSEIYVRTSVGHWSNEVAEVSVLVYE